MADRSRRYFPLFINLEGKKIVVFGAGRVAVRRIRALQFFHAQITVVAPEVPAREKEEMEAMLEKGSISYEKKSFTEEALFDAPDFVLAATDDARTNERIVESCRKRGIWVNNASDKSQCDFYFPAIALTDGLTAGIAGDGTDHKKVAEAAKAIRICLERMDETGDTNRQPGK